MLSENSNNGLKELSDNNKESETDEENENVFINLEDIERRIEYLKMNKSKPRVFEQGESSNRASYVREEISTYENEISESQYFRLSKRPKREYKTLEEYKERLISHEGI